MTQVKLFWAKFYLLTGVIGYAVTNLVPRPYYYIKLCGGGGGGGGGVENRSTGKVLACMC